MVGVVCGSTVTLYVFRFRTKSIILLGFLALTLNPKP
jgi:hypothetical protein